MFGITYPFVFCLAGFLFARIGYRHFKTKKDKKHRCTAYTDGKIVDMSAMKTGRRSSCAFPTYEYIIGAEVIRIKYCLGTPNRPYKIGDSVKVWYDPNYPDYSYIDGYREDSVTAIASLIAGTITICIGLFVGCVIWFR